MASYRPASLVLDVAAADATRSDILVSGVAGLAAGALSMAAGEYVSVSSQSDTERADLDLERRELALDADGELRELAGIYGRRGVDSALARRVAQQLMARDALAAHARDELGISENLVARPLQAALASAAAFAVGAAVPILTITVAPERRLWLFVAGASLICLGGLGALAARQEARHHWSARLGWRSGERSRWPSPRSSGGCSVPWCERGPSTRPSRQRASNSRRSTSNLTYASDVPLKISAATARWGTRTPSTGRGVDRTSPVVRHLALARIARAAKDDAPACNRCTRVRLRISGAQ